MVVSLRADQIVSGTAINLIALGITGYLYVDIYGAEGTPDDLPQVPEVPLPTEWLGFLGGALANQNLLVWAGCSRSRRVDRRVPHRAGLRLRSVGENPRAAETVGVSVTGCATSRSSPRARSPRSAARSSRSASSTRSRRT